MRVAVARRIFKWLQITSGSRSHCNSHLIWDTIIHLLKKSLPDGDDRASAPCTPWHARYEWNLIRSRNIILVKLKPMR